MNNDKIKKEIAHLMKKPEMWMGISIILVAVIFGATFIVNKLTRKTITNQSVTPTASVSAILNVESNDKLKTVVKKLADTSGEISY